MERLPRVLPKPVMEVKESLTSLISDLFQDITLRVGIS